MAARKFTLTRHLSCIGIACSTALPIQLPATELEEIVVTAQKREQNLQDVGISVTAFSSNKIKQLGLVSSTDIAHFTPGMSIVNTAGEGNKTNTVIRGVGLSASGEEIEGNVAIYQDEVYIGNRSGLTFDLFDIERIEVLRGPQGTLYGNTSTGGLVHYISKKPTDEFEANISTQYGEFDHFRVEAAVSGSFSDSVRGRLSGLWNSHNGYFENDGPAQNDQNSVEAAAIRGQLEIDFSDSANVLFSARWSENDPDAGPAQKPLIGYLNPATGLGEELPADLDFFGTCAGCDTGGNKYTNKEQNDLLVRSTDIEGALRVERKGVGAIVNWDIGGVTVTSITDYIEIEKDYAEDGDGGLGVTLEQFTITKAEQFLQEIRVNGGSEDSFLWNVGAFYYTNDTDSNFAIDFLPGFGAGNPFPPWLQQTFTISEKTNWSVFANTEFRLSDSVTLIAGLRYFEEDQDREGYRLRNSFIPPFDGAIDREHESNVKFDNWAGKVELDWHLEDGGLLYASISRGVRPGLLDSEREVRGQLFPFLDEEELTAYEIGYKADIMDSVRLNTAIYYYDYKDRQTRAFEGFESFLFNVDSEVYGLDVELTAQVTDRIQFSLNAGFLEGTIKDLVLGGDLDSTSPTFNPRAGTTRDTDLPNAPDTQISASVNYTLPFDDGASLDFVFSGSYRSDTDSEAQNNPVQAIDSYSLFNTRITYFSASEKWEAGVYLNNMFDEEYVTFVGFVTSVGVAQQFIGRPRWGGVFFNYNW